MAFFDKLNQMAKNIGDKTSDAIETSKLNSKINAETTAAGEDLKKIGEFYYNRFISLGDAEPEVLEFCQNAKSHYDAVSEAQAEINRIKTENEAEKSIATTPVTPVAPISNTIICPNCGTSNGEKVKFCCSCGSKLEICVQHPSSITCQSCNTKNEPGVKFCCECGNKLESCTQPEKRACSACNTEMDAGIKFCPNCGQKME